jgi:hypothetical protein
VSFSLFFQQQAWSVSMKFGAAKMYMRIMYIMLNRIGMFAAIGALVVPNGVLAADESPLLLKSRELTAKYATLLQAQLQDAMATGGPVAAIAVCKDEAPRIASELSRSSGARVGRTTLKFRNPGNAPDDWQRDVLTKFDSGATDEFFAETPSGETRFMKAIPTGAVCLACHGQTLAPEIQEALDTDYPHDRARGYELGQIRGAFSITWPARE